MASFDLYSGHLARADAVHYEAHLRLDTGTHNGDIRQLAASADGRVLVSAGESSLRVWDAGTQGLVRRLLGAIGGADDPLQGQVRRFALSPDGRWVVVLKEGAGSGWVTELQVFELATGNLQSRFEHAGWLLDLAFSPDGRWLALAGRRQGARSQPAVLMLHAARSIVRAGFHGEPAPLATLAFASAAPDDDLALPLALRVVPAAVRRGAPLALVLALGGAAQQPDRLVWARFVPGQGLARVRQQRLDAAIDPATLAVSAELAVVAPLVAPRRCGRLCWYRHDGRGAGDLMTEAAVAATAFSPSGRHLLAGLVTDAIEDGIPAAGDQPVQANVYAASPLGLALQSSYYGHDSTVGALTFLDDGTAVSAGGDDHAIHAWQFAHRVGALHWAIRGVGRTMVMPGVTAAGQVLFGTVPLRLLPPRHPQRQQSFDLRRKQLRTTAPSDLRRRDYASRQWFIVDDVVQVIPLRHNQPDRVDDDALPPDLTLFVGADDQWVLWSRSGYFDASPDGARRIGYHVNRGPKREALFVPADRFKAAYRPDLIAAVVRHGSEARARARGITIPPLDVAAMLPPIVELVPGGVVATAHQVRFTFRIENLCPEHPVTRIWILRNDRFVWTDLEPRARALARYTVTLPLVPGLNRFSIRAESGLARSVAVDHEVMGPEAAAPGLQDETASGNLYLLSVGVSDFAAAGTPEAGEFQRLQFAHRDAAAIHQAFGRRNRAFDAVEASLLVNAQATRAAILRELNRLCTLIHERGRAAGAERDVLFVFLSGHGVRFQGEPDLYFWCHDLRPAAMESTGLPLLELGQLITSVPAEVVLVVDACHAAMAGGNVMAGLDAEEVARRVHAVNERGMYVLNAARSEQKAREDGSGGLGVFTGALLATLASDRFVREGRLSMISLIAGLQQLVPQITARSGEPAQTPVCRMYGDLLPLTIHKA